MDDLRRLVRIQMAVSVLAVVALLAIFLTNEADDTANRKAAVNSVCETLERFADAEVGALEAIFEDSVSPEALERGRRQFQSVIQPALDSCRVI